MPSGARVSLTGETSNGFAKLTYQGTTGWASSQYLSTSGGGSNNGGGSGTDPGSGNAGSATTTSSVNLRAGPSTSDRVLLVVPSGAGVTLTGTNQNGFSGVSYNGTRGWISSQYLSTAAAANKAAGAARASSGPFQGGTWTIIQGYNGGTAQRNHLPLFARPREIERHRRHRHLCAGIRDRRLERRRLRRAGDRHRWRIHALHVPCDLLLRPRSRGLGIARTVARDDLRARRTGICLDAACRYDALGKRQGLDSVQRRRLRSPGSRSPPAPRTTCTVGRRSVHSGNLQIGRHVGTIGRVLYDSLVGATGVCRVDGSPRPGQSVTTPAASRQPADDAPRWMTLPMEAIQRRAPSDVIAGQRILALKPRFLAARRTGEGWPTWRHDTSGRRRQVPLSPRQSNSPTEGINEASGDRPTTDRQSVAAGRRTTGEVDC